MPAEMAGSAVLTRYVAEIGYRCALILWPYSRPHSSGCAVSEDRDIVAALVEGDLIPLLAPYVASAGGGA